MTIACLKGFGEMPFLREKFTSFVNEGRRISIHFLTICMGHGSRENVFEGASLINLRTSLSETTWEELIVGGSLSGRRDLDGVCLKVSLICLILSMKKQPNLFDNDFSSSKDGRTVALNRL